MKSHRLLVKTRECSTTFLFPKRILEARKLNKIPTHIHRYTQIKMFLYSWKKLLLTKYFLLFLSFSYYFFGKLFLSYKSADVNINNPKEKLIVINEIKAENFYYEFPSRLIRIKKLLFIIFT